MNRNNYWFKKHHRPNKKEFILMAIYSSMLKDFALEQYGLKLSDDDFEVAFWSFFEDHYSEICDLMDIMIEEIIKSRKDNNK